MPCRSYPMVAPAPRARMAAALGLDTDLVKVKSLGIKPIVLAFALWANLLGGGFLVSNVLVNAFG